MMGLSSDASGAVGIFAFMDGLGRALFGSKAERSRRGDGGPHYWSVMYIDDNGVLHRSTMRVITLHPDQRSLTVWCDVLGREHLLKLSKIVEACDLRSGRRLNLARWVAAHGTRNNDLTP